MVSCMSQYQSQYQNQSWCMTLQLLRIMQFSWIFLCISDQRYATFNRAFYCFSIRMPTSKPLYRLTWVPKILFDFSFRTSILVGNWNNSWAMMESCLLTSMLRIVMITCCDHWHLHFQEMVKEKKLIYSFDASKKARFGVLPRYAKDDLLIRWFELPNCFIFHNGIDFHFFTVYIPKL